MDFRTGLEARAFKLVGDRVVRVRYCVLSHEDWQLKGPGVDSRLDSILLDFDSCGSVQLAWSSKCGYSSGLDILHDLQPTDIAGWLTSEHFKLVDVSQIAGWQAVLGEPILEARLVWDRVTSLSIPPAGIRDFAGRTEIDLGAGSWSESIDVPLDLGLRFARDRWVVVSLFGEDLMVTHDDEIQRRDKLGPYA